MVYESIAHEAKGRMGYLLEGHEGKRSNCFSKNLVIGAMKESNHVEIPVKYLFLVLKTCAFTDRPLVAQPISGLDW